MSSACSISFRRSFWPKLVFLFSYLKIMLPYQLMNLLRMKFSLDEAPIPQVEDLVENTTGLHLYLGLALVEVLLGGGRVQEAVLQQQAVAHERVLLQHLIVRQVRLQY